MPNIHATLAFLGEVDPSRLPALRALGAELPARAFDVALDRLGYWPRQRIVYAGSSVPPAALAALASGLKLRLAGAGFPTEERPYVLHVTLLRDVRRAPATAAVAPLLWHVRDMLLIESVRAGGMQLYRPIERFTLTA